MGRSLWLFGLKDINLWNHIDMPERFGERRHNKILIGQSSIRIKLEKIINWFSNENIWWGPSIRNSIMMSNHAQGFKHITFNTVKPINTFIGNFEWQVITGRLENHQVLLHQILIMNMLEQKYMFQKLIKMEKQDDWRYLQAYIISLFTKMD